MMIRSPGADLGHEGLGVPGDPGVDQHDEEPGAGEGRVVRSPPENWHRPPYVDTELSIPEHWGLVVDYSYPVSSSVT